MDSLTSYISKDYRAARACFLEFARRRNVSLETVQRSHAVDGPLFTDFCQLGHENPERILVVTSGLHGVEGFLGSAIQCQLLDMVNVKRLKASDAAIFMGHALNPFGFHSIRRVNENNVDLNRNFLLADERYEGAHAVYRRLNPILNPRRFMDLEIPFRLQVLAAGVRQGFSNVRQAIASGQYDFPMGIFYGGAEPQPLQKVVKDYLLPKIQSAQQVIHLDVHTGLGKSADYELLLDHEFLEEERLLVQNLFGDKISEINSLSYSASGSFNRWIRSEIPRAISICFEFGTKRPLHVLKALRNENMAYHWGDRGSARFRMAKRKLKNAFFPDSITWKTQTLSASERLLFNVLDNWLLHRS